MDSPRLALSGIALALTPHFWCVAYEVEGVTLMRTPAIVDSHEADGGQCYFRGLQHLAGQAHLLSLGDATHTRIEISRNRPVWVLTEHD